MFSSRNAHGITNAARLKFVGMNVDERGRLAKKSQSRQREKADAREIVVLPRKTFLQMEEGWKILSEICLSINSSFVFIHNREHWLKGLLV